MASLEKLRNKKIVTIKIKHIRLGSLLSPMWCYCLSLWMLTICCAVLNFLMHLVPGVYLEPVWPQTHCSISLLMHVSTEQKQIKTCHCPNTHWLQCVWFKRTCTSYTLSRIHTHPYRMVCLTHTVAHNIKHKWWQVRKRTPCGKSVKIPHLVLIVWMLRATLLIRRPLKRCGARLKQERERWSFTSENLKLWEFRGRITPPGLSVCHFGCRVTHCRWMCQDEILARPSVNISSISLDQYFIYTTLLSINLLSSLRFPPSFCMIDWLIDSVFLLSCIPEIN